MIRRTVTIIALGIITVAIPALGAEATDIVGTWLVEEKTGKIEVFRCGETFCGKIIWIKPSIEQPNPETIQDIHNPNPDKRLRKILGSTMMWGLGFNRGEQRWEGGRIYDNRSGKIYRCRATLGSGGKTLRLRGFIGISLLGKTTTWTRLK